MKPAGLILPLILATALLAAEPASTTAPAEPAAASAPAPAPASTPAPAATTAPVSTPAPANDATAKPAPQLSPAVSERLTANLPKYTPVAAPTPATPAVEADPDTLLLSKVVVKQKKRPRLGDEVMMTNAAFNEKLAKEKTSSFDRDFLNKYSILGGASAAERAREEYDRAQRTQMVQDVSVLAKAIEQEDPAQAKALRDAAAKP